MATLSIPPSIEYGVASCVLSGQVESGDRYLVRRRASGVLVAAIDGIGHGDGAASAAKLAVMALENARADESVTAMMQRCHDVLRNTRGVVMSLASIDSAQGFMTWIGVGNVQGVMLRRQGTRGLPPEELLLRAGVVGAQLPPLQASVLPITRGDTVIFATDGIHSGFVESASALEPPQKSADRILAQYRRGNDDALVLVTRYLEDHR